MSRRPAGGRRVYAAGFSVAAALAALLYALIPLGTQLAADFYVEHFQALFHLGALSAACAFWGERRAGIRERFGWLVLAGLLAGLACGAKYAALLLTLLPLLLLVPLLCALGGSIYEGLRAAACVAAPALAVLAPWLVRNLAASGDPLYPLGLVLRRRLLGGARRRTGWITSRPRCAPAAARWPTSAGHWRNSGRAFHAGRKKSRRCSAFFWLADNECGPHLLFFAVPGFLSRLRGETFLVAGFVILDLACWFLFTHRLNRFFFPALRRWPSWRGWGSRGCGKWGGPPMRRAAGGAWRCGNCCWRRSWLWCCSSRPCRSCTCGS